MPQIACPGCKKQYKVPASAAGQVATCKACGKKFRVTATAQPSPAVSKSDPPPTESKATSEPIAVEVGNALDDDFWDEALGEEYEVEAPDEPVAQANPEVAALMRQARREAQQDKKKASWGVDWAKVGGGLLTSLIAAGVTVGILVNTGYLYFWPAGIAVVGLLTALSGLMGGEDFDS